MAEGRTDSAIAAALRMSESGVEKHVNAIFTKLDLPAEPSVHRRVTAVITHLRNDRRAEPDAAAPGPG
jgi:DNA-binding NarL/FixJ family response regulator